MVRTITSLPYSVTKLPDIPEGYNYDFVNADALVNVLSVKNGSIVTPSGMTYRVLALDENSRYMSLPVLKKIRDLVMDGAVVTGPQPAQTPSLSDNQDEFSKIVHELWTIEKGENKVGNGKVYAGYPLKDVLNSLKISPDFTYSQPLETTKLLYVHRKLGDIDFYWVNNRQNKVVDLDATFRVDGQGSRNMAP